MAKWQRISYQPGTPLGRDGRRATASEENTRLSLKAAEEGMVLLKNEKETLPLSYGSRVALFGKGTFDYVKGGGGSGDVTVSYTKNIYDGLKSLGGHVKIYEPLADFYREKVESAFRHGRAPGMTIEPEVPKDLLMGARAFTDTAIISICRFSGEGWDRKSTYDEGRDMGCDPMVKASNEVFEKGDFYLSDKESAMVREVLNVFPKVIAVLNVGGMVDSCWFADEERISSVLMAWQGGMEGGMAAARLLCGEAVPCGKLSDTFARRLEDYPSSADFHESNDYVNYTEDIYVGYRYFETMEGVDKKVNYPFGYGLSYTTFVIDIIKQEVCENHNISLVVNVTNTGKYAGREVVQLYASCPEGKLFKPSKELVAFAKTHLLKPGESQRMKLQCSAYDYSTYDDLGKVCKSSYVLEKGSYRFFVGNSVRDVQKAAGLTFTLSEDIKILQLSEKLKPSKLPKRMLGDGSFEQLEMTEQKDFRETGLCHIPVESLDGLTPVGREVDSVCLWQWRYKKDCRPLMDVVEGKMEIKEFVSQMTDDEVVFLLGGQPNTGVANTFGMGNMPEYGIPNVMTADGPAGLRIEPQCGVCTTAWPCATLLACTWDEELMTDVGRAGALEVKENNIGMWLTPAINIHRSPLCGRNFEYYSEDPLLTGKMAAAMVRGIQSQNISASVKHFALNNKETNRKNSDSRVSERAAREIYLKAFEIIVKEAKPWCIMSSYNVVNGVRASENKELLSDILRGEWEYEGMVTSDWWSFGEQYKEVAAGNDIKMALGFPKRLLEALEKGLITREQMNVSAERILKMIMKLD